MGRYPRPRGETVVALQLRQSCAFRLKLARLKLPLYPSIKVTSHLRNRETHDSLVHVFWVLLQAESMKVLKLLR